MNSREALEIFARHRRGAPAMTSAGRSGQILWEINPEGPGVRSMGMAYVTPACLGISLFRPGRKVVAVDGDGSMLMGLPNYITIGRYQPRNLTVLVVNNRHYLATSWPGMETASFARADLVGLARAAGIENALSASTSDELEAALGRAMTEDGPFVVVANVDTELVVRGGDQTHPSWSEQSVDFRRYLTSYRSPEHEAEAELPETRLNADYKLGSGAAAARVMYAALKNAGVDFVVYLPESIQYGLQQLAKYDPEMPSLCCTREDEGIAIAAGASYTGRTPAIIMEGTGVGFCGLVLADELLRNTPFVIMSSHSHALGMRRVYDIKSANCNEAVLRALNVPTTVLSRLADAETVIRESVIQARMANGPQAIVVPPYVMDELPA